jgi:hypothetical protein
MTDTFTAVSKSTAPTWYPKSKGGYDFLLMEDGYYLLQENNYKIELEQSILASWTAGTKHTASWTAQSQN